MNAMLSQLDPATVVTRFGDIASAGKEVLSTSIPRGEISTFVSLALKAKNLPVSSVSFVPPRINTGDPDWELIRAMVGKAIEQSTAKDGPAEDDAGQGDGTSASHKKRHRKAASANASTDLARAC